MLAVAVVKVAAVDMLVEQVVVELGEAPLELLIQVVVEEVMMAVLHLLVVLASA